MKQAKKKGRDIALLFLAISTFFALTCFITYLCIGINFILGIVFLIVTRNDPYPFRYAKANMAITLALIAVSVLLIAFIFAAVFGTTAMDASTLQSGLTGPLVSLVGVCMTFLLYGVGALTYGYLAYKAYKKEECPWF